MGNQFSWTIRMFPPDNYDETTVVLSNMNKGPKSVFRPNDHLVVFAGMYGLDDYLIWRLRDNLVGYDFSTGNLDLKFYTAGGTKDAWHRLYKVMDVRYDLKTNEHIIFAIGFDSLKLTNNKLIDYDAKSLNHIEGRGHVDVLKEVLEKNNIFKVIYEEVPWNKEMRNFKYDSFTFPEWWRPLDFIQYIADQNNFEWYVKNKHLYISKECLSKKGARVGMSLGEMDQKISSSVFFKKYKGPNTSCDLMGNINEDWRCIWVKHAVGRSGGITSACFQKVGRATINKENYFRTLDGQVEKSIASRLLSIYNIPGRYVQIGNILKDDGDPIFIDEISVQKNKDLYGINEPQNIKMDREDTEEITVLQTKQKITRSTPYLEDGAGLLFPSVLYTEDVPPPNSLIFNVDGKEESSVIGPYVMGNSDKGYVIPFKDPGDYRFSLPNGWTMYVDGKYGKTLLQCSDVPSELANENASPKFPYQGDELNPDAQEKTYIYMRPYTTERGGSHFNKITLNAGFGDSGSEKGAKLRIASDIGFEFEAKTQDLENKNVWRSTKVQFMKTKVVIQANNVNSQNENTSNKITIDSGYTTGNPRVHIESNGDVDITSAANVNVNVEDGDINLNCGASKNVVVKEGGVAVSLTGHSHPWAHTHQVPIGPAIPGPPSQAVPPSGKTDGESDKHSKRLLCEAA